MSDLAAALDRIALKITSSLELGEVLAAVTDGLMDSLDAAAARIWLREEGPPPSFELRADAGLPADPDNPVPPAIRRLVETGDHLCTNSPPTDGSLGAAAWILENGLRSIAALPLTFRDQPLGVLAVFVRRHLAEEEFERLFLFARQAAVAIQNARLYSQVERLKDRLTAENQYLQGEMELEHNCGDIVGRSDAIHRVLDAIERVAATDASVLIQGETGTGKELVALAIHKRSKRRDHPMVKINCGAISVGLVESELFGHEKGAFTGATEKRVGRFEVADGGTLFLDEVGELPADTQVKLLRALQEQEFERVGSSRPIKVDVRVIAAGNRNLAADVAAGRFRADLYYRLNVFPIVVPPLRERLDDVPLISACVLGNIAQRVGKPLHGFSPEAMQRLQHYGWPGNVRELLNVLERAAILSPGPTLEIDPALLEGGLEGGGLPPTGAFAASEAQAAAPSLLSLDEVQARHIRAVLEHTDGVIEGEKGAARILDLHPNTLRSRMKKLGIARP